MAHFSTFFLRLGLLSILLLTVVGQAFAQSVPPAAQASPVPDNKTRQGRTIVQFSGLVVAGEKAYGVPGANIVVSQGKRGASTNLLGYFSVPVLEGDTARISAVGFRTRAYVVPSAANASHSVIIYMEADTMQLPTVEVVPFPTEALFKEAFLALKLDNQDVLNARKNLDPYGIEEKAADMPMDGRQNYTAAMNSQIRRMETGSGRSVPTLSLLDPFAWARFIESVKRGDLKKKDKKDKEKN